MRGEATPQSFKDNHNDTVTDNRTGLTWQKKAATGNAMGHALSYCEGLYLGGIGTGVSPTRKSLNP